MILTRKKIIIASILLILVVLGMWALFLTTRTEPPKDAYIEDAISFTVDKDTGERLTNDPNLSGQTEEASAVTVLGVEELVRLRIVDKQIDFAKEKIRAFSKERLGDKFATITIRPQGLTYENNILVTTIRLGQGDELLPILFTASPFGETRLVINDPENKYGGIYDTGEVVFGAE